MLLISSIFSFYLWRENQKLKVINSLLLNSLIEADNLARNAGEAYRVFGECASNQSTCNLQESVKKLQELNNEKEEINSRIQEIQKELRPLE